MVTTKHRKLSLFTLDLVLQMPLWKDLSQSQYAMFFLSFLELLAFLSGKGMDQLNFWKDPNHPKKKEMY